MVSTNAIPAASAYVQRHRRSIIVGWAASFAVLLAILLAVSEPLHAPAGGVELNGDFERGVAPWLPYGTAVLARSTTERKSGSASAAATAASDGLDGLYWPAGIVRPSRGDRYAFSAALKGDADTVGADAVLQMNEHDALSSGRVLGYAAVRLSGAWRHARVTGVVRGRLPQALDFFVYVQDASRGQTLYVDDVRIERLGAGR